MKGATILLLDDNREARWPLARVLRAEGAEVTEADDGTDGLKLLERTEFDLIIADVCMLDLGGFGLFSKLRFGDGEETLPHRDVPIILITGQISRGELARGLEAGLDDFIAKPVDLDEFRARARAVIRRSKACARPHTRTQGDLRDFGISALTQALALSGHSGRLTVRSGKSFGVLDFHSGHLVHAHHTAPGYDQQGEDAALHVLGLEQGSFELEPVPASAPRTIFGDTQGLILRFATHADEHVFVPRTAAGASPPPSAYPAAGPASEPVVVHPVATLPASLDSGSVTGPLPPPLSQAITSAIVPDVQPLDESTLADRPAEEDDWVDVTIGATPPATETIEISGSRTGPVEFEIDENDFARA